MKYRIVKWHQYQHYKNRRPPWIKLHVDIIRNETWIMLDDASKLLAICCMIAAAMDNANDGTFTAEPAFFQKLMYLEKQPNFKPLVSIGFIEEIASDMLASCKQLLQNYSTETETETETDKDKDRPQPKVASKKTKRVVISFSEVFEKAFAIYPHRPGDGDEKDKQDAWKKWLKIKNSRQTIDGQCVIEGKGDFEDEILLCRAAENYADECKILRREEDFFYKITNFYGRKAYYKKYLFKKAYKIGANNDPRSTNYRQTATQHHASVVDAINNIPVSDDK